jgi:hypothetical protein
LQRRLSTTGGEQLTVFLESAATAKPGPIDLVLSCADGSQLRSTLFAVAA